MSEARTLDFDILTKNEAAKVLRMTPRNLELMVKRGTAPPVTMVGGRRRFRTDLLADWLASRTLPPGQRPEVRAP